MRSCLHFVEFGFDTYHICYMLHIVCLRVGFDEQRRCLSYASVCAHNCYRRCADAFVWHHGNIGLGLNREACVAMHRSLRAQGCLAPAGPCRISSFHNIRINTDDTCYSRCNGVSPKTEYLKVYLYAMMSEALKVNTVLTNINLYNNKIGDVGAAALAQVLEQMFMLM